MLGTPPPVVILCFNLVTTVLGTINNGAITIGYRVPAFVFVESRVLGEGLSPVPQIFPEIPSVPPCYHIHNRMSAQFQIYGK